MLMTFFKKVKKIIVHIITHYRYVVASRHVGGFGGTKTSQNYTEFSQFKFLYQVTVLSIYNLPYNFKVH